MDGLSGKFGRFYKGKQVKFKGPDKTGNINRHSKVENTNKTEHDKYTYKTGKQTHIYEQRDEITK